MPSSLLDGSNETPPTDLSAAPRSPDRGLSITALVLGVVGLINPLAAIWGIGSIVFGVMALKAGEPSGLAKTSVVLGGVACAFSVIFWVVSFWIIGMLMSGPTSG